MIFDAFRFSIGNEWLGWKLKGPVQYRFYTAHFALFARQLYSRFSNPNRLSKRRALRLIIWTALLLAALFRPAANHSGIQRSNFWAAWTFDPLLLLGLGLAAGWYEHGWQDFASRGSLSLSNSRRWAFRAGLLVVLLALLSPLNALTGELLSAHMLQHMILIMVAAPLLVLGMPLPLLLFSLPRQLQLTLERVWASTPGLRSLSQAGGIPLMIWLFQAAVFWGWHAPQLYLSTVENEPIHTLQHLSYLIAALLFWWVTLNYYAARPGHRVTAILYLFTTILHSGMLGALIAFSSSLWYPVYAGRTEVWGLSAMVDQQLAGIMIWVPAGLAFMIVLLALFNLWIVSIRPAEGGFPGR